MRMAKSVNVLVMLLVDAAVTLDHYGPAEIYQVMEGHLLLLKCPNVQGPVDSNVTWAREGGPAGATASLPSGVEVRDGILYFLPALTSHNGSYICESTLEKRTLKVNFGVSVLTGLCPPAAEVKTFPTGVRKSLPCKLEHILRLEKSHNIRWLKDCHPVERAISVLKNGLMRLVNVTREDAGTYTCLVDASIDGRNYTSAVSIELDIETNFTFPREPEVIQEKEQVLSVTMGERVELKCSALMDPDNEAFMYWIVNGSFTDTDPELEEWFNQKQGLMYESTLTISRVLPRFLNVSIRCRVQNSQGVKDCFMQLREGGCGVGVQEDKQLFCHPPRRRPNSVRRFGERRPRTDDEDPEPGGRVRPADAAGSAGGATRLPSLHRGPRRRAGRSHPRRHGGGREPMPPADYRRGAGGGGVEAVQRGGAPSHLRTELGSV
ncbi:interleukin-1 receptor type 2-like isoform X4 [Stigmatopora argus]